MFPLLKHNSSLNIKTNLYYFCECECSKPLKPRINNDKLMLISLLKKTSNRSNGASSSAANTTFIKHTSPTLNDESSEQLAAPNAGGGTSNSQSGSLGASISDLSSEASEFSDPAASNAAAATTAPLVDVVPTPSSSKHPPLPKKFTSKASVDVPSGASTPTKSSRLPIPKKN